VILLTAIKGEKIALAFCGWCIKLLSYFDLMYKFALVVLA